jgi:hypothetical protein
MVVEESRIFEVCAFRALQLQQSELIQSETLLGVMTIADEADRQLDVATESMTVLAA